MKLKASVRQNITETRSIELSDSDIQGFLDDLCLCHANGERITLGEVHDVFHGTMADFTAIDNRQNSSNLYSIVCDWAKAKAAEDPNPEMDVEETDSSVTSVD
jgi:hypothetical protein